MKAETPQEAINRLNLAIAAVDKTLKIYRTRYNKDMSKANYKRKAQYSNLLEQRELFARAITRYQNMQEAKL